ncbi:topoisomerase, putative [Plasmodium sp. DRC-Itaito]|nr:topoisomerase, putative [Plasmodium sp. DRC-Itaito]
MMNCNTVNKKAILEAIEDFVLHIFAWFLDINVDILKNNSDKKYSSKLFDKKLINLCRTLSVVELVNEIIMKDKSCTQREIYYKFYNIFSEQNQTNKHIKDVCNILGYERSSLNIYASEKGCIAGLLILKKGYEILNLSEHENGLMINEFLLNVDKIESMANYIIVVEKYSVYQKLCENKIWNIIPCILITGKGFPDLSTRKIVCELMHTFQLECVYVGDFDPHGIKIFLNYKEGIKSIDKEYLYACKNMKWIGMCSNDIMFFPKESLITLTKKEKNILQNLINDKNFLSTSQLKNEIIQMDRINYKFEIEAVQYLGMDFFIKKYLIKKILRKEWLT